VRVISLAGKADYAEHLIVASATSARRVTSMAEHLVEKFKAVGLRPHVEGLAHSSWVLIDAGDLVVHLFKPDARSYYNLEKLWEAELTQAAAVGMA
jgi:ribosome silencing factor RsfS/YbeB/iojap